LLPLGLATAIGTSSVATLLKVLGTAGKAAACVSVVRTLVEELGLRLFLARVRNGEPCDAESDGRGELHSW